MYYEIIFVLLFGHSPLFVLLWLLQPPSNAITTIHSSRTNGQFASLNYIWLLTLFLAHTQTMSSPVHFPWTPPPSSWPGWCLVWWPSPILFTQWTPPPPSTGPSALHNYPEFPIKAASQHFPFTLLPLNSLGPSMPTIIELSFVVDPHPTPLKHCQEAARLINIALNTSSTTTYLVLTWADDGTNKNPPRGWWWGWWVEWREDEEEQTTWSFTRKNSIITTMAGEMAQKTE